MALKNSITLDSGITVTDAYIKIDNVYFTQNELNINVSWYATQEARDANKPKLQSAGYSVPYAETISISSCYDALKLLPDFSGSSDC